MFILYTQMSKLVNNLDIYSKLWRSIYLSYFPITITEFSSWAVLEFEALKSNVSPVAVIHEAGAVPDTPQANRLLLPIASRTNMQALG